MVSVKLVEKHLSRLRRQLTIAHASLGIDFKNMIDHGIHGVPHCFKMLNMLNRRLEKCEGPVTPDAGQDNQTGVNVFGTDKSAKIARILGNDDKFASDAPLQHAVVGRAAAPEIQRVFSNMLAAGIQLAGYLRGQALINKQAHAAS